MINVWRVRSRVESGGHDVPEEKIIVRYDRALALVKDLVEICDICHIYDNTGNKPFRIFKKRKEQFFYDECKEWYYDDIQVLTAVYDMEKKNLNNVEREKNDKEKMNL